MTVTDILTAIEERSRIIIDCEQRLKELQPAFLFDYEEVDRLENRCEDALAQRDALFDLLRDGGDRFDGQ